MSEEKQEISLMGFFIGSLIINSIAGILILATDFGGFYYESGSLKIWEYLSLLHPISGPIIAVVAACFFYSVYFSLMKLLNKEDLIPSIGLKLGFYLSIVALTLVGLGTIAVVAVGVGAYDWWFDAGFYAGIIGGILNLVFYILIKNQKRA